MDFIFLVWFRSCSGLVQLRFSLQLKFNSLELGYEVGQIVNHKVNSWQHEMDKETRQVLEAVSSTLTEFMSKVGPPRGNDFERIGKTLKSIRELVNENSKSIPQTISNVRANNGLIKGVINDFENHEHVAMKERMDQMSQHLEEDFAEFRKVYNSLKSINNKLNENRKAISRIDSKVFTNRDIINGVIDDYKNHYHTEYD